MKFHPGIKGGAVRGNLRPWLGERKIAGLGVLLFLVVTAVFLPALKNGFVNFDDPVYVTGNPQVQAGFTWAGTGWAFGNFTGGNWNPLTWLSHMLDCQLYGLGPWGHHLTSVLIHALNAVLVFVVLRRMTGATWRSFFVAAVFGLHPLRVESVAWVAERKDVLSALFWWLALWAYARFAGEAKTPPGNAKKFYALALLFFCLGLMAKPMLVTLPCVMLLLDCWPLQRISFPAAGHRLFAIVFEKWPFFLVSFLASIITFAAQKHGNAVIALTNLPFSSRVENSVTAYARYLGQLFCPENLCVYYPQPDRWPPAMVAGSVALLAAISFIALRQRRGQPWLLTGWLWFLGTLVPVIGLVQVGQQSMADRYTYIPQVGLLIALAWGVYALTARWRQQTVILATLGTAALVACAVLTHAQIAWWKNGETLFRRAIAVTDKNFLAHMNLGTALDQAGRFDEAIEQHQAALKLSPASANVHYNLGVTLSHEGRFEEAIAQYRETIKIAPNYVSAYNNLGIALSRLGRPEEAISQYQQAIKIDPHHTVAHNNLGTVLDKVGRFEEAIAQYQVALKLDPGYADARDNLAVTAEHKKQSDETIRQLQEAVRLDPGSDAIHYNLGNALMRGGRVDEAIEQFQTSLKLKPGSADAHNNLGVVLFQSRRIDEAIGQFQAAVKLKPDYAEAQKNLAAALAAKNRQR